MLKKLLKLLDSLPLNGDKTKIGAWLTGLTGVWALIQQLDPDAAASLVALLTTQPISWIGVGVLVLGLIHKYLKRRYTFVK